ncbi:MAG TPA: thioredoxin family protein [Pirellulaceae bacterium]|nr:thioredoxin family protein [Pirellulaceae bacterium]HMO92442.1 thioredoxin family protein [Pirellulaceae bacterium]HMP67888.1 thioredoxin family protein [Pirellulaceae bacterium]
MMSKLLAAFATFNCSSEARFSLITLLFSFHLLALHVEGRANCLVATDDIWSEDAATTVAESISGGRDILVLFTGSDWCPPCIQLETKILSQTDFQSGVKDKFLLLRLDYPRNSEQQAAIKEQNTEWAKRYGITSFPTVMLLDPKQRPYAFTGFRDDTPEAYATHISNLQQIRVSRDEFFAQAEAAQGDERANLLDQGLSQMTIEIAEVYYETVIEEIASLDKEDKLGLRSKYFAAIDKELRKEALTDMAIAARLRRPDDALQYIDERLAEIELPPSMLLQALNFKLQILSKEKRYSEAIALLDEMLRIPELTPVGLQRLIIKKVYLLVGSEKRDAALEILTNEIKARVENLMLVVAKGEVLDSGGDYQAAVNTYDQSLTAASSNADMLVELIGAKADALVELGKLELALSELDKFADNTAMPADLRAEVLVHKAMILREQGQTTAALRSESRALEIVQNKDERAQVQRLIDQVRERSGTGSR